MPARELLPQAQQLLLVLKDTGDGAALVERLDEFFPDVTEFSWLTTPDDPAFTDAFYLEFEQGGWLTAEDYTEFWTLVEEHTRNPGSSGLDRLSDFLERLVGLWEVAADETAPIAAQAQPAAVRYECIDQVGKGYPGWWQGYDSVDGVWRYIKQDSRPDVHTRGWMPGSQAFPKTWPATQSGTAPPSDPTQQQRAEAVYYLVTSSSPGLSPAERGRMWNEIWSAVDILADWTSLRAQQIADRVLKAHLDRRHLAEQAAAEIVRKKQALAETAASIPEVRALFESFQEVPANIAGVASAPLSDVERLTLCAAIADSARDLLESVPKQVAFPPGPITAQNIPIAPQGGSIGRREFEVLGSADIESKKLLGGYEGILDLDFSGFSAFGIGGSLVLRDNAAFLDNIVAGIALDFRGIHNKLLVLRLREAVGVNRVDIRGKPAVQGNVIAGVYLKLSTTSQVVISGGTAAGVVTFEGATSYLRSGGMLIGSIIVEYYCDGLLDHIEIL